MFDVGSVERLVANKRVQATRGSHNDMRACILGFEDLGIRFLARTAVEDGCSNIWHVFAESFVFLLDLVGKLACVTEHNHTNLTCCRLDLLQRRDDENGGLACMSSRRVRRYRQAGHVVRATHPFRTLLGTGHPCSE